MKETFISVFKTIVLANLCWVIFLVVLAWPISRTLLLFLAGMYVILYNWIAFLGFLKQSGVVIIGPVLCCFAFLSFPCEVYTGLAPLITFCKKYWYLLFFIDITTFQFIWYLCLCLRKTIDY